MTIHIISHHSMHTVHACQEIGSTMKVWGATILWGAAFVVPRSMAKSIDHTQTVICIPDNHVDSVLSYYVSSSEHPFCMNGGTCKQNFEDSPEFPCDCPAGLTGPHCEFEQGIVPECTLECFNGGQCQPGIKYPSETVFQSNEDLQYCICPEGYYGKRCEVEGKRCGSSHCFNGGSCVSIEQDDGTIMDHCDCTTAGDEHTSFAGRFCQSPASVSCSKFSDHNGKHFCVNGGQCRSDSHRGCDCPEGFTGPVCEFREREEEDYATCSLPCQNKGICRKGAKDVSILGKFNVPSPSGVAGGGSDGTLGMLHNEDFEHCVCPVGYVGVMCEFRLDVCPGRTHVCMHGAKCHPRVSPETHKLEFTCDCDRADEHDLWYSGKYCQYKSTEFCTDTGARPPDGTGAFCVNGGACIDFVPEGQTHPGCDCQNNFHGAHCEFAPEWRDDPQPESQTRSGMAISLPIGCTLLILLIIFLVVYRRQKKRELGFRPNGGETLYKDEHDSFDDGDMYDLGESIQGSAPPPTISDIDFMFEQIGQETSTEDVRRDGRSSGSHVFSEPESAVPSMSSMGSHATSFTEDTQTGRAMIMKEPGLV